MGGKTVSVLHVIRQLEIESIKYSSLQSFDFVNVNGIAISNPSDVHALLWNAMSSQKLNHANAFYKLDIFIM